MAKQKSPKISIITPVYNADLYLEECLNSLVNQTLQDIEIICVNDNSKDKSLKILENFSKKDKRIKIINFEQTYGQSRARNVALEQTSGKYIGFVDADDFVDPDMFEKMYKKAQNSDIVMCQAKVFDDKVKTYKDDAYFALDCFDDKFAEKPFTHEDTKDFATEINVSVWNKIYRAEFLKKSGVKFQEGFIYEDLPYFYEVYTQAKKVVLLKEFLYSYRINNQNSTMTRTDKNVKDRVDMASRAYDILKKQKYFEEIKSNVLNTIIHDLFYRCLIIDSRYQKEYFFRMQKFFRTLDTTDVDDTLIKSRYYPHFCEIKKRSYDEIVKYFFNQETLGAAYVEHAKKVFKRDFDRLETEKSEITKNSEILKKSKSALDKNWKDFEKEKQSQLDEISRRWSDFEKNKKAKLAELDKLQAKILQDEKARWADFEQKSRQKEEEISAQQAELDVEWKNLETEKVEQEKLISGEWKKFEEEKLEKKSELDKAWKAFKSADEKNKAEASLAWKKFEEENSVKQAELDAAWEKYKKDSAEREKNLDEMQDKILTDEKERWSKFEEETSLKKSELIEREKALTDEFEQKKQALKKLEDEHWEKINARQEELKKAEYELDKAWEKFKIDNLTREKELDGKQAEILSDEKERWKKYELQVADFERQKVEFAKEKELALKEIDRQWSDFEKEKQSQLDEIARYWADFEKEKQLQLCEIDRQHKFEKLTIEKTKNYLSNKYLSEIEEEKVKLAKNYAEEISASKEYFSDLMQKQLKIQEENYRKTDIFKEKIKEEMMQRPKVSIILPVYNVAPYLKQSLDSIISQTLTDIEIICVDDGSTDESGKILDEYKEKDARIKVIHKKNAGTGAARNDGLKIATGECIGFVDPDDWILPNMYERLYNILQDKELDIVMFTPDVFNDQTQKHEGFLYFQDSNFP
ncbi:MAG: glycosyltransferase, partial [bacterium]|nr:glycosyltransferase [bacterium]